MDWHGLRERESLRLVRELGHRVRRLSFRERLDFAFLGVVGAVVLVAIIGLTLLYVLQPEVPLWEPIRDERILTNVRDKLDKDPLVDAVYDHARGQLVVARGNGLVHRYSPATGLWERERIGPIVKKELSALDQLQMGCGPPGTEGLAPCPMADRLWAVTRDGGLAVREAAGWRTLVSDKAFRKSDGIPVSGKELTKLQVSTDGNWLLAVANDDELGDQLGLYRTANAHWQSLGASPVGRVETLAWWDGRFWLGGTEGLASLTPSGDGPRAVPLEDIAYSIRVVEPQSGRGLWVLGHQPCPEGASGGAGERLQLRLVRAGGVVEEVIGEAACLPELDSAALRFVQDQGDYFLAQTLNGIYVYTHIGHRWTRLVEGEITATSEDQTDTGLWYARPGEVGWIQGGKVLGRWTLPADEARIRQLVHTDTGMALGLSDAGSILRFARGEETPEPVYSAPPRVVGPPENEKEVKFHHVLAEGDRVLFIGTDRALAHGLRDRSYRWHKHNDLARWLYDDKTHFVKTDSWYYAVTVSVGQAEVYRFTLSALPPLAETPEPLAKVPMGVLRAAVAWADDGIALLDEGGGLRLIEVNGQVRYEKSDSPRGPIHDIEAFPDRLLVATDQGLYRYDLDTRGWNSLGPPKGKPALRAIASRKQEIFGVTAGGRLIDAKTGDRLVGSEGQHQVTSGALDDVLLVGKKLYLAGSGYVDEYDTEQRELSNQWRLSTRKGAVELVAVLDGQPLTLAAGMLSLGRDPIAPSAGKVLSASLGDGFIWTVRRHGDRRYLRSHRISAPFAVEHDECRYRHPVSHYRGKRILDALPLDDRRLLVLTDTGLETYDRLAHNWHGGIERSGSPGDRLYRLGNQVLWAKHGTHGFHLSLFDPGRPWKAGHCDAQIDVLPASRKPKKVRDFAVDETHGQLAWLDRKGILQFRDGTRVGGDELPDPSSFLRFHIAQKDLWLFASAQAAWTYDVRRQQWKRHRFMGVPGDVKIHDVIMENDRGRVLVNLVAAADGAIFSGDFSPTGGGNIRVTPLRRAEVEPTALGTSDLIDVQMDSRGHWLLLFGDRLVGYDPNPRRWIGQIRFPSADVSRRLMRLAGHWLITDENGARWWVQRDKEVLFPAADSSVREVFRSYRPEDGEQQALGNDGTLYRLRGNGKLSCLGANGKVPCPTQVGVTMRLQPDEVLNEYEWGRRRILITRSGMRLYNFEGRRELRPATTLADTIEVQDLRIVGAYLWILTKDSRLYRLGQDGVTRRLAKEVDALRVDPAGNLWVLQGTRAKRWDGRDWSGPSGKPVGQATVRSAWIWVDEAMGATTLHADGTLDGPNGTLQLPDDTRLAESPKAVFADLDGQGYWLLYQDSLVQVTQEPCPVAEPVPESPLQHRPQTQIGVMPTSCPTVSRHIAASWFSPFQLVGAPQRIDDKNLRLPVEYGTIHVRVGPDGEEGTVQDIDIDPSRKRRGRPEDLRLSDRSYVKQRPDGEFAYDPIQGLELRGTLVADRPSGAVMLGKGEMKPMPGTPLEAGWIGWDRARKVFRLRGPTDPLSLGSDQMIVDRRFRFDHPGVAIARPGTKVTLANRFGLWQFAGSADGQPKHYLPVELPGTIRPIPGYFLTAKGSISFTGEAVDATAMRVSFGRGALTLKQDLRRPGIQAELRTSSGMENAFAATGFRWDHRRGLAWHEGVLHVFTDAGVHPAVDPFKPVPTPAGSDRLRAIEGAGLHLERDGQWFRLDSPSHWHRLSTAPVPRTRQILDEPPWRWSTTEQRVEVSHSAWGDRFVKNTPNGIIGFNSDRLQAAAWTDQGLLVASSAGLELDATPLLDSVDRAPGSWDRFVQHRDTLYAFSDNKAWHWNPESRALVSIPADQDPRKNELLAQIGPLRFDRLDRKIHAQVQVRDPVSGKRPLTSLDISPEGLALDRVRDVLMRDDELWLVTDAGLIRHEDTRSLGLAGIEDLARLSNGDKAMLPIERLGRPQDEGEKNEPEAIRALAADRCIQWGARGTTRCPEDWRKVPFTRGETALWHWQETSAGRIQGNYRIGGNKGDTLEVVLGADGWRHDSLLDAAYCRGQTVTLWRHGKGVVLSTIHSRSDAGLTGQVVTLRAKDGRFLCLETDRPSASPPLRAGLYLRTGEAGFLRLEDQHWSPVNGKTSAALEMRFGDRMPVDRARLRIFKRDVQYHDDQGTWQRLRWQDGALSVDRYGALTVAQGRVWAATDKHLLAVMPSPQDSVNIDLDRFAPSPLPCSELTDFRTVEEEDGDTARLRCAQDSRQRYATKLPAATGEAAFEPLTGPDFFAERTLVDKAGSRFGDWTLSGRKDEHPGRIEGKLQGEQGEPVSLDQGRFSFDDISDLVAAPDGHLYTLSRSSGWQRSDALDLKTIIPGPLTAVRTGKIASLHAGEDGTACAVGRDGRSWRVRQDSAGSVPTCLHDLGDDPLWSYRRDSGDKLRIFGKNRQGGHLLRQFEEGRFPDDRVRFPPTVRRDEQGNSIVLANRKVASHVLDGVDLHRTALESPVDPSVYEELPVSRDKKLLGWGLNDGGLSWLRWQTEDSIRQRAVRSDLGTPWTLADNQLLAPNWSHEQRAEMGLGDGEQLRISIGRRGFVLQRGDGAVHLLDISESEHMDRRLDPLAVIQLPGKFLLVERREILRLHEQPLLRQLLRQPRISPRSGVPIERKAVRKLQQSLADQGYPPGPIDGVFGSRTIIAVNKFLADFGLYKPWEPNRTPVELVESVSITDTRTAPKPRLVP